jgi:ribosomal protein S18 acetylase RimI-like enzyme
VIRVATEADLPELEALWREFCAEVPDFPWREEDVDEDLEEIADAARGDGLALVSEEDGEVHGMAVARPLGPKASLLVALHVRPAARRAGVARALVHEVSQRLAAGGVEVLELDVLATNEVARAAYDRWGFEAVEHRLAAPVERLAQRLGRSAGGRSFGTVHVQTDDRTAVERAVAKYVPRLGRSERTEVSETRNGWTTVRDELSDRDPEILRRLACELSNATGAVTLSLGVEEGQVVRYALYDRGGVVDEYLSVPEYFGDLPPGDVVALGANPTVVARLTGADPARIRSVARTAASPADLPAAEDLYRELANAMGVSVD